MEFIWITDYESDIRFFKFKRIESKFEIEIISINRGVCGFWVTDY